MGNFYGCSDAEFLLQNKLYKELYLLMMYNRKTKKYIL